MDEALVANECMDTILKNGDSGILGKLDLGKAYDSALGLFGLHVGKVGVW